MCGWSWSALNYWGVNWFDWISLILRQAGWITCSFTIMFFVWLFVSTGWRARDADAVATAFNWIKFVYSWGDSMAWLLVWNKPALIAVVLRWIENHPQISVVWQMALSHWVDYLVFSRFSPSLLSHAAAPHLTSHLNFSIYGKVCCFFCSLWFGEWFYFIICEWKSNQWKLMLTRCASSSAVCTLDQGFQFKGLGGGGGRERGGR